MQDLTDQKVISEFEQTYLDKGKVKLFTCGSTNQAKTVTTQKPLLPKPLLNFYEQSWLKEDRKRLWEIMNHKKARLIKSTISRKSHTFLHKYRGFLKSFLAEKMTLGLIFGRQNIFSGWTRDRSVSIQGPGII